VSSTRRLCLGIVWLGVAAGCGGPPLERRGDGSVVDASGGGDGAPAADASPIDGATPADAACPPPEMQCGAQCIPVDSDPANCGACGHDCLGGSCAGGLCEVTELATVSTGSWRGLSVDDTHIYWVDQYDYTPWRRAKDLGTPPEQLVPPGTLYATRAPVLDGGYIYLTDFICCNYGGRVWRLPRAGGMLEQLGMWGSSGGPAMNLAVDATSIYVGAVPTNEVYSFPKAGGSQTLIAALGNVMVVAVDDSDLYIAAASPGATLAGQLARTPKAGGGPVSPLFTVDPPQTPVALSLTDDDAFLATTTLMGGTETGGLYRVSKATGAETDVAVGPGVGDVTADSAGIAWVELSSPGRVWVGDLAGGAPALRATGYDGVIAVAVDAMYVYWMTAGMGGASPAHVYRVPR
jgi:hypothetical protein